MTRGLSEDMVVEVTAESLAPILFVEVLLDSSTLWMWSGVGDLVWDSKTWSGVGNFLGVGETKETQDVEAQNLSITLSGIPTSLISLALTENYQGRTINLWFGCLDSSGAVIADPELIFRGKLDVLRIAESGETATIKAQCESNLVILTKAKERRYTSEDQKIDYPSDTFFDQVPDLQNKEVQWGRR